MNKLSSRFPVTIHFTCHVFSHGLNQVVPAPSVGTCMISYTNVLSLTLLCSHALIPQPDHHPPPRTGPGPDFDGSGGPRRFNSGPNAGGSRGPEAGGLFQSLFSGFGNNNINNNNDRSASGFGGSARRSNSDPMSSSGSSRMNRPNDSHHDRSPPGAWLEDLD